MSTQDVTPRTSGEKTPAPQRVYHPIEALQERMNRMFDDVFGGFNPAPLGTPMPRNGLLAPRVDVSESDKAYKFAVELPGVEEQDLSITLLDGVLTIKGEKKSETKDEKDQYVRTERRYGSFQRSFSLPSEIDEGKIEATLNNGVLTVTVPRSAAAKSTTKEIKVKSA